MFNTLTIVGVGLIGGSLGLAAKERGLVKRVRGLGRNQTSLDQAKARGAIDEAHLSPEAAVAGADFVVLCTPVDQIAAQALEYSRYCSPGAILTDAGSTKSRIVATVEQDLVGDVTFVGSHPLAGSEKRGPLHADANLFRGRWTVVTRTPQTNTAALAKVQAFWEALGSRVVLMSPDEHDRALALTSHLPHLVASGLAGLLTDDLLRLAATGFRDTTRIAASDPPLWRAIFEQNREAVLEALTAFSGRVATLQQAVEQSDWRTLESLLAQGKKVRDALGS